MHANDFAKYVGSKVLNELDEIIGVIIGYTANGLGEINSVLIKSPIDIHEVSLENLEKVDENTFKFPSPLYLKYKNLERKVKNIFTRLDALNKFTDDFVNKDIFMKIKNKTEESLKEIQSYTDSLKNEVLSRMEYLNKIQSKIEEALIEIKLSYVSGSIDKTSYDSKVEHLLSAKNRLVKEMNYLKEILNSLENLNKTNIIEVRIIG